LRQWEAKFSQGSEAVAGMGGTIHWHEALRVWALFGRTHGKGGIDRSWNAFGQKPWRHRSNMVVEMNIPPKGVDKNIQAVFAQDRTGLWLLHQGRMSISGKRVTQDDFIAATGLQPTTVRFSDGSERRYHKAAGLDAPAAVLQEQISAFVSQCAKARAAKQGVGAQEILAIGAAQDWEHGLSPEATGQYDIAARNSAVGRRRHAEVWRALAAALEQRGIPHSNDRVAQYGPDLFTYGGSRILFEIKSDPTAQAIFAGVGQLQIYERLLRAHLRTGSYRKVLVVPAGMKAALQKPLEELKVSVLSYDRSKGRVNIDARGLAALLK
jgi:hypothetical protein